MTPGLRQDADSSVYPSRPRSRSTRIWALADQHGAVFPISGIEVGGRSDGQLAATAIAKAIAALQLAELSRVSGRQAGSSSTTSSMRDRAGCGRPSRRTAAPARIVEARGGAAHSGASRTSAVTMSLTICRQSAAAAGSAASAEPPRRLGRGSAQAEDAVKEQVDRSHDELFGQLPTGDEHPEVERRDQAF